MSFVSVKTIDGFWIEKVNEIITLLTSIDGGSGQPNITNITIAGSNVDVSEAINLDIANLTFTITGGTNAVIQSIVSDPDLKFQISPLTNNVLQLQAILHPHDGGSHDVEVQAVDSFGKTYNRSFTINVTNTWDNVKMINLNNNKIVYSSSSKFDNLTTDCSMNFWFSKTANPTTQETILDFRVGTTDYRLGMLLNTSGYWQAFVGDGLGNKKDYSDQTDVCDGNQHMLTMTWSSGTLKLYVDKIEATTNKLIDDTLSGNAIDITGLALHIGETVAGTFPALDVNLSNISMYNAALTQERITEIYNSGDPFNMYDYTGFGNMILWVPTSGHNDTHDNIEDYVNPNLFDIVIHEENDLDPSDHIAYL